jgi:hypothetical protein
VPEFSRQDQFLLTFGKNYIAHSGEKAELYCDEYDHQFEKRIETHAYHDYYYINANILSLLTHLPFLKAKKKPLLINEAILNPSTTSSLQKLLAQHDIDYVIASESDIGKKLDDECASVLIIDDALAHEQFLQTLHQIIPSNIKVTLITDAGVRTPWFRQVIGYGWDVIGRIYDGFSFQREGEKNWFSLKEIDFGGRGKARLLGKGKIRKKTKRVSGYVYTYKEKLSEQPHKKIATLPTKGNIATLIEMVGLYSVLLKKAPLLS